MKLQDLFPKSAQMLDLKATDKSGAIREMLGHLVELDQLSDKAAKQVEKEVLERESQASTGIGRGLGIPHAKNSAACPGILGVFARTRDGLEYNTLDGEPVRVLFLVISSAEKADDHVAIMRGIARLGRDASTLRFLASNADADSVVDILKEFDEG